MALIKYEPLSMLNRMQNELNQFFRSGTDLFPSLVDESSSLLSAEWTPRMDMKEDDKNFIVTVDIPGVEPKDIQVTMENGMLDIKGERKEEKEEKENNYFRKECMMGSFERMFRMPDNADSSKISAKGKNGVLTITIGKKASSKPQPIRIETEH